MLATIAPLQVTTRAAVDRFQWLASHDVARTTRRIVLGTIRLAVAAQHLRHLQGDPLHGSERLEVLGCGVGCDGGNGWGNRSSGLLVEQTFEVAMRR